MLVKSDGDAANCWRSLLEGQYECDAMVLDQMEKKMTLERFQREVYNTVLLLHVLIVFTLTSNRIQALISVEQTFLETTREVDRSFEVSHHSSYHSVYMYYLLIQTCPLKVYRSYIELI